MQVDKFYGQLPTPITEIQVDCKEMMFYQYLPIKLIQYPQTKVMLEHRLEVFRPLIERCCVDFIDKFGLNEYWGSYVYLTAKHYVEEALKTAAEKAYFRDFNDYICRTEENKRSILTAYPLTNIK